MTTEMKRNKKGHLINPTGDVYAYIRVSTKEQKVDRQLDEVLKYGVKESHIFTDQLSGKTFNRPSYKRLIHVIRKGDIVVIKSIDRLGRNYNEILEQWRLITQDIGCGIHVIDMPSLNTSGDPEDLISRFITDMMLQVLSFVAQNERENTIKRQKEGIAAAQKRGKIKIGRPKVKTPYDFWEYFILWNSGEVPAYTVVEQCCKEYGMSQRTFYRRARELDMRYGDLSPQDLRNLIVEDDFKDGIEFDMERCEAAIGIYSPYTPNPEYVAKKKAEKKKRMAEHPEEFEQNDPKSEEEELKRIILEKRQEEFRKQFGIKPKNEYDREIQRGRKKQIRNTKLNKESIQMAEDAMTKNIKTVIID